jgi:perosamine synthetase
MRNQFDSISGTGAIRALEDRFREFVGTRFAIAMCNATSAIHAALMASGVHRGDEIITQSYSWGGSITGALQLGAIPAFADVDSGFGLDPDDLPKKISPRTKAVLLVHLFGFPSRTNEIRKICEESNIALIEDCAQAFGATQNGQSVGSAGIGCFSFSAGKALGVGDGGMLTTDDRDIFESIIYRTQHPLRQLREMDRKRFTNQFALNYRMSEHTAVCVLKSFDGAIRQVENRARELKNISEELPSLFSSIKPIHVPPSDRPSWHRYSPDVDRDCFDGEYSEIDAFLKKKGFAVEKGYVPIPLHRDPALQDYLPVRRRAAIKHLDLPATEKACNNRIGIAINSRSSNQKNEV